MVWWVRWFEWFICLDHHSGLLWSLVGPVGLVIIGWWVWEKLCSYSITKKIETNYFYMNFGGECVHSLYRAWFNKKMWINYFLMYFMVGFGVRFKLLTNTEPNSECHRWLFHSMFLIRSHNLTTPNFYQKLHPNPKKTTKSNYSMTGPTNGLWAIVRPGMTDVCHHRGPEITLRTLRGAKTTA